MSIYDELSQKIASGRNYLGNQGFNRYFFDRNNVGNRALAQAAADTGAAARTVATLPLGSLARSVGIRNQVGDAGLRSLKQRGILDDPSISVVRGASDFGGSTLSAMAGGKALGMAGQAAAAKAGLTPALETASQYRSLNALGRIAAGTGGFAVQGGLQERGNGGSFTHGFKVGAKTGLAATVAPEINPVGSFSKLGIARSLPRRLGNAAMAYGIGRKEGLTSSEAGTAALGGFLGDSAAQRHYADASGKLDAPVPEWRVVGQGPAGQPIRERYSADTMVVPNAHARYFFEHGQLPPEGKVVPDVYPHQGQSTFRFDPETGRLMSWSTDNPAFATSVQQGQSFGLSARRAKPSELGYNTFQDLPDVKRTNLYGGEKAAGFGGYKDQGKVFEGPYDKMNRFEIDDSKSYIKQFPKDSDFVGFDSDKRLGDYLEHPELFKNYPDLADIPVVRGEGKNGTIGDHGTLAYWDGNKIVLGTLDDYVARKGDYGLMTWDKDLRRYRVKKTMAGSPELQAIKKEYQSTLLHELQHTIQQKEGFATGDSSRSGMDAYRRSAGELEARDVQHRFEYPYAKEKLQPFDYAKTRVAPEDAIVKKRGYDHIEITPRIENMIKSTNGMYDFKMTIDSDRELNNRVVAALKKKGIDINDENYYDEADKYLEEVYREHARAYEIPEEFRSSLEKYGSGDFWKLRDDLMRKFGGENGLDKALEKNGLYGVDTLKDIWNAKVSKNARLDGQTAHSQQVKNAQEPLQGPQTAETVQTASAPNLKERGFTTSVKEAANPAVSAETKAKAAGSYVPKPNESLMGEAKALLSDGASIDFKNTKDLDQKVAATIQHALNLDAAGDHEAAANLYNNLAEHGTNLGRGVQAFSLLEKMSPEAVSLSVAGKIKQFNRVHGAKIPELTGEQAKLISEKTTAIMGMPEGREKNIAIHELGNLLSDFIPSSAADKAIAVWKAGLLTSLRTHERNFVGNAVHGIAEIAKDVPAAGADMLMSAATGQRTMSATTRGLGAFGSKSTGQQMADIVSKGFDPSEQVTKFDYKRITWGKNPVEQFLKHYTDAVFNTLGASDKPFYNAAMARSLYDQAGAAAINAGRRGDRAFIDALVASPTEDMVKAAVQDANTATFKNKNAASAVSTAIKQAMQRSGQQFGGNVGGELGKIASEMTMPFTGVPSSILGQTVAYSPVGLLKGMAKAGRVMVGQVPELQRSAAQELGRGVIGTGVYGLGAYLAGKGLITGQPKDAAEAAQWDMENKPRNSILINGRWRSLNSIGPEAIVALAGAKLAEEGPTADYALSLAKDQLDQSFMQGLQSPVNAITDPKRYAKSYLGGQLSSGIPNLFKDAARSSDQFQREKNTVLDYAKEGLPGARKTLNPKRDVLGNPMPNEPRGAAAFFDVFNSKTPNGSPVVAELGRLLQSGNGAAPSKLGAKYKVFGQSVSLDPKQLDQLEATSGGEISRRFGIAMASPSYQGLTDEQKAKVLSDITDEVRSNAKKSLALGMGASPSLAVSAGAADSAAVGRPTKDQLDMAKFQVEADQKTRKVGDTYVFYNPDTGKAEIRTEQKIQQDAELQQIRNDMDAALKTKDYAAWRTAAEKQYALLEAQTKKLDPVIDAAEILRNQNEMQALKLRYLTYKGYGGLSKPKKGKAKLQKTTIKKIAPKKLSVAKESVPKSALTTQKLKTLSLKAPNGTAKPKRIQKSVV